MPLPLLWNKIVGFGRAAEIRGSEYLRSLGYRLLRSPYRTRHGEVDIVAEDGGCLVFVEVKARHRDAHPEDSVNTRKQRRIIRAARQYRRRYRLGDRPYRFDILAIVESGDRNPRYRLIKDAFRE